MTYALLLFPANPDIQVSILGGYPTEAEATAAGDAAELDAYFDHYLVIPAPPQTTTLTVNQGGGGGGGNVEGGGGGGNQRV